MTGTEDQANTRPISVAELLARNGTIGAPPVGGRRRRRRGDGSITVAELTGEIPVIREEAPPKPAEKAEPEATANGTVDQAEPEAAEAATEAEPAESEAAEPAAGEADEAVEEGVEEGEAADTVAEEAPEDRDEDLDFFAPPRRSLFARKREAAAVTDDAATVGAEQMSPDPWPDADEQDSADAAVDLLESDDSLFGGPTGTEATEATGEKATEEEPDLHDELDEDLDEDYEELEPAGRMSGFLHGLWVVAQCVVAVAFGAGLFIAFDQLWQWNSIVALVLGVLVILGLVVGVRVVRKTEDIGSTLIAVAVGALVTFGPLALIQAA
ncbi:hypothetical protein [Mycolicibacterium phlei]